MLRARPPDSPREAVPILEGIRQSPGPDLGDGDSERRPDNGPRRKFHPSYPFS